jgi:hypothetical protein
LINLTAYSSKAGEILSCSENISLIYEMLINSEKTLTENLIWLLGNMIIDNGEIKKVLLENNIFEYLAEKLENITVPEVIKEKICWFLSNFFKNTHFDYCQINVF